MAEVFEIPVYVFDYGYGDSIKIHRFHEWAQLAHLALVKEASNSDGVGWVYIKHRSVVLDAQVRPKKVRVRTWLSEFSGGVSTREYTIHDETDNALLFQRSTTSVALDLATLKPTTRDLSHLRRLIAGESLSLAPMALEFPPGSDDFSVARVVEPDDIDHNRHVNNTAYVRWIYDAILRRAFETEGKLRVPKRVRDLQIRYLRPVSLGSKATLKCVIDARNNGQRDWKVNIFCEGADRPAVIAFVTVLS